MVYVYEIIIIPHSSKCIFKHWLKWVLEGYFQILYIYAPFSFAETKCKAYLNYAY